MVKIGLISDTHGYIDDRLIKFFENCDEVWHAGDIGHWAIIEKLAQNRKVRAVYGNIDNQEIRIQFPENNRFKIEGIDVWITHIGGYPKKYDMRIKTELYRNPPKLFICGHSHILKVIYDKDIQCLHINPGAYGKQGFHKVRTAIRFDIQGNDIKNLEILEVTR